MDPTVGAAFIGAVALLIVTFITQRATKRSAQAAADARRAQRATSASERRTADIRQDTQELIKRLQADNTQLLERSRECESDRDRIRRECADEVDDLRITYREEVGRLHELLDSQRGEISNYAAENQGLRRDLTEALRRLDAVEERTTRRAPGARTRAADRPDPPGR